MKIPELPSHPEKHCSFQDFFIRLGNYAASYENNTEFCKVFQKAGDEGSKLFEIIKQMKVYFRIYFNYDVLTDSLFSPDQEQEKEKQ